MCEITDSSILDFLKAVFVPSTGSSLLLCTMFIRSGNLNSIFLVKVEQVHLTP